MVTEALETQEIFIKQAPVRVKADENGIIEAIVSVFDNEDSMGDVVMKGAFRKSLESKMPPGVWSHNWEKPIAKTLEARETDEGLYIKARLIKGVQAADEAYLLMKEGVTDEFSFGYRIIEANFDPNDGINYLKELDIHEWSPVLKGANPNTRLISIKRACGEPVKKQDPPEELTTEQKFSKTLSRLKNLTPALVKAGALSGEDRQKVIQAVEQLQALLDVTDEGEKGTEYEGIFDALSELRGEIGTMKDERGRKDS